MNFSETPLHSEESAISRLQKLYTKFGYSKFRMSKFEDYTLYLQNKDFLKGGNVITFNGPSGRLLALKQDVTLSIVKNAKEEDFPCKLFYIENVYRASNDANDIREIPQAGVEYIGNVDTFAMSEVIQMAAESLAAVSDKYIIGLSHMGLVRGLLDAGNVSLETQKEMLACIQNKSTHELLDICRRENIAEPTAQKLAALSDIFGRPDDCFEALSALVVNVQTANAVAELREVYALLCETGHGDCLRIDFSVANDMQYYNGITFQGFVDGTAQSVLSGGRYDDLVRKFDRNGGAIGFAVYLDLLQYNNVSPLSSDILVLYDPSDVKGLAAAVAELRKDGARVSVQTRRKENETHEKVYIFTQGRLLAQ